jgi:uncharacterized iron-regulated membrane protein
MRSRSLRLWSWIHRWSSLVCTLFMLLLCITGLPLIFHHEIGHLSLPERPALAAEAKTPTLASIMARALAARPGERVNYLYFDDEDHVVVIATAQSSDPPPQETYYQYFDLRDGWQLQWQQPTQGFLYVLQRLLVDLFADLPGTLLLGTMGLLLIVSIVSGIVLYAPFMRRLPFGVLRAPRRAYWLDMHNLLGIITVVWLGVVALTGAVSTLARPINTMWQGSELKEMAASPPDIPDARKIISPDEAIERLRDAAPNLKARVLAMPGTPFASPHHIGVYLIGDRPLTSRMPTPALVDAGSGRLVNMREMPLYAKALFISQPLHFGDYGGMPLKILWAALDIVSIILLGSGLYLWLRKPFRKPKNRKSTTVGATA